MPRLMFRLKMVGRYLGMGLIEQQAKVLNGTRLPDARGAVNERAGRSVTQTSDDQVIEGLDGWSRNAVVAGFYRMQSCAIGRASLLDMSLRVQ